MTLQFGILQYLPQGTTQVGQPLPIPQNTGGGDSGIGGLLGGLSGLMGGMKSMFGSNPVSQANQAISHSMASAGPAQIAQSLMPQSTQTAGAVGAIPQGNLPVYGSQNGSYPISQPQYQQSNQNTLRGLLTPNSSQSISRPIGQPYSIAQPHYQANNQNTLRGLLTPNSSQSISRPIGQPYSIAQPHYQANNQAVLSSIMGQKPFITSMPSTPSNPFGGANAIGQQASINPIWGQNRYAGLIANQPQLNLKTPQIQPVATPYTSSQALSNPYFNNSNYPINLRQNNFGNIRANNGHFATYNTPEEGLRAQSQLLDHYAITGRDTPTTMIRGNGKLGGWSETDQGQYINGLSKALGISPNDKINMSDPATKAKVMQFQMQMEGGNKLSKPLFSTDQIQSVITKQQEATSLSHNTYNPQVQQQAIQKASYAAAQTPNDSYKIASSYMGMGRQNHPEVLSKFFEKSGMGNLNIQNTPWCAAFANSVLAAGGIKGTNSLSARSFLPWGTPTNTPTQGDVVVFKDMTGRNDPAHGHVGFYAGETTIGGQRYIQTLGGNQSGQVSIKNYPASAVVGYRIPPNAQEIQRNPQMLNFANKATNWNAVRSGVTTNPMINPVGAIPGMVHPSYAATPNPAKPFNYQNDAASANGQIVPHQLEENEYEAIIRDLDKGKPIE